MQCLYAFNDTRLELLELLFIAVPCCSLNKYIYRRASCAKPNKTSSIQNDGKRVGVCVVDQYSLLYYSYFLKSLKVPLLAL